MGKVGRPIKRTAEAVVKEINSTCECFSKQVILEEFGDYFEVLEREIFHEVLR